MDAKPLWSWLVRSDAKTELYVPPELGFQVTNDEFAAALRAQAHANRLPIDLSPQTIEWDVSGVRQERILIKHVNDRMNLAKFLTGLDQFGSFYYVEEKLYWEPPVLPIPPRVRIEKEPIKDSAAGCLPLAGALGVVAFYALGFAISGLNEPCLILALVVVAVLGFVGYRQRQAASERYEADRERWTLTVEFDNTVKKWIDEVRAANDRSRTDDEFGRFVLAVRSTIRQTVQKLFVDRQAELRDRKENEISRQELEAELEKRKGEGFK